MNKKLMILAIVTVMVSLISLGGSQVLSKGPGFKPNYNVDITVGETGNGIVGNVGVEWSRGRFISSELDGADLTFVEETTDFWEGCYDMDYNEDGSCKTTTKSFAAEYTDGWLSMVVDRQTGRALFEYRWTDEDGNFDLAGYGNFYYNKKTREFTFVSDGPYEIWEWFVDPPPEHVQWWEDEPEFVVTGTPIKTKR